MPDYRKLTKAALIEQIGKLTNREGLRDAGEPLRLAHDLQVHQLELEMQNQEMREAQQRLEEARDRYADLYDFAPTGYVTLDARGRIREINLTGAALLGHERAELLGKPFSLWVARDSLPAFLRHLRDVSATQEKVVDEIDVRSASGDVRHISVTSVAMGSSDEQGRACRTALVDISKHQQSEEQLRQSRQLLRELSAHHDSVREEERKRIAREVHDELGQKLTALQLEASMLAVNFGKGNPRLSEKIRSLLKLIDSTMEGVRTIASDLRPAVLDLGLGAAIEWQLQDFEQRSGIRCELLLGDPEVTLDDRRATAIFRILQEALTNIARHANATRVMVTLAMEGGLVSLRVRDNGIGIADDSLKQAKKFGIPGIRERVLMLAGEVSIEGKPGSGTELSISIPAMSDRVRL
jgi:PAS domain S-box-containing protein